MQPSSITTGRTCTGRTSTIRVTALPASILSSLAALCLTTTSVPTRCSSSHRSPTPISRYKSCSSLCHSSKRATNGYSTWGRTWLACSIWICSTHNLETLSSYAMLKPWHPTAPSIPPTFAQLNALTASLPEVAVTVGIPCSRITAFDMLRFPACAIPQNSTTSLALFSTTRCLLLAPLKPLTR